MFATAAASQSVPVVPGAQPACTDAREVLVAAASSAPPLVSATLNRFPGIAFRFCRDERGLHYFLRAPEPARDGVCIFNEVEVFSAIDPTIGDASTVNTGNVSTNNVRWFSPPAPWTGVPVAGPRPTEFLAEARSGCPLLNDLAYVQVENVSDGMFKSIAHLWQRMFSSKQEYQIALSHLSDAHVCRPGWPDALLARLQGFDEMQRAALGNFVIDDGHSLRIFSIGLVGNGYGVMFEDQTTRSVYRAVVDATDTGVEISCFGVAPQA
jgi:hypothetical protein